MDKGFCKADSNNLPVLEMDVVLQFCIENAQHYSTEMKNIKTLKSSKETYGDSAIGYVQLKRVGPICTVKGRITPEHKIHKKAYNVEAIINEVEEKVLQCKCTDCAASAGGCKHSMAFLFWIHRRSEESSVTSQECYWKSSNLSKVGTTQKYLSAKDMAGVKSTLETKNEEIKEYLIKSIGKSEGGIFDFYYENDLAKCDIYQLIHKYKAGTTEYTPEDFTNFA